MAGLAIGRSDAKLWIDGMPRAPLNESGRLFAPVANPWPVTGIASGCCRNVHCRLARRPRPGSGMASCAGTRRPPEYARGMASFAANQFVRRIEDIARRIVIERQIWCSALLCLSERPPLPPQKNNGNNKQNKEEASNAFHGIFFRSIS